MANKATRLTKTAKPRKSRAWTREDVRILKALASEKTRTSVIGRKLKRTERATYQKARMLGVTMRDGRKKKGV
jgi:hypothetical protein